MSRIADSIFDQTAEWWMASAPDGRPHYTLYPYELMEVYGETGRSGWHYRRTQGVAKWGDVVPFTRKLKTGNAAHMRGVSLMPVASLIATEADDDVCPLDAIELTRFLKSEPRSIVDVANHFDCSPNRVSDAVAFMRSQHLIIDETAAGIVMGKSLRPMDTAHRIDTAQFAETEFCIGVTADNHIGSKYERNDVLDDLFTRYAAAGVTDVYCAGNWIDGSGRKFNQHDVYVHGIDNQIANFLEKWPRKPGIKSHILSGDDHEGWFVQDCHVNVGHVLQDEARIAGRDDIFDLGYMERDVEFVAAGGTATMRVAHMGGGTGYALSYSMQKYAESLQGGEKPQIVIGGHYHKFDYNYAREIHLIQPGCTEDQTPFMRKKKLQAMLGGCILWIRQNELGILTSVKIEWMPYYDKKFYAYQWQGARASE